MFVEVTKMRRRELCAIALVDAESGNKLTISYGKTSSVYFQGRGTELTLLSTGYPEKATECYEQFKAEWVDGRKVLTYTDYLL